MKDVLAGRKRITPLSVDRVAAGLGLDPLWHEYFRSLVAGEESAFHNRSQTKSFFEDQISLLRAKLSKRASKKSVDETQLSLIEVFLEQDFPEVYASLGDHVSGAGISEIMARSRLPRERVKFVLEKMEKLSLVSQNRKTGQYIARANALSARDLRSSRVFRQDFTRSLEKARHRVRTQGNSKSSLFMTQTFSVSRKNLGSLRKQLASLIESFALSSEEMNGDCIAELCLSFSNNSEPI